MRTPTLPSLVALLLAGGCAASDDDHHHGGGGGGGGKADGFNVAWDADIPNIVPEEVHTYLEEHQWGDYHLIFHMSRRYFLAGERTRAWLDDIGERNATLQEGDPDSGVEFLAMHRAMIDHLRDRFGDTPVHNNQDGRQTFGEVLDGWNSDAEVRAQIVGAGADPSSFDAAVVRLDDAGSFESEDAFGLFLQTSLRLSRNVDEDATEVRSYDKAPDRGVGMHNALHGVFADGGEIDVGDPQRNLSNQVFWAIHGWVEWRWRRFEQAYVRTPDEVDAYETQLEKYGLHMQLHSDFSETHVPIAKPTPALAEEMKSRAFTEDVDCVDVDAQTTMDACVD